MKIKSLIIALLLSNSLFALENTNDTYTEFNYEKEMASQIKNVLKNVHDLHLKNKKSFIAEKNKTINEIEDRQRVKFILKDYKKVDIYVRENYSVISNDYVVKNPSGWRRILIKESNIWE